MGDKVLFENYRVSHKTIAKFIHFLKQTFRNELQRVPHNLPFLAQSFFVNICSNFWDILLLHCWLLQKNTLLGFLIRNQFFAGLFLQSQCIFHSQWNVKNPFISTSNLFLGQCLLLRHVCVKNAWFCKEEQRQMLHCFAFVSKIMTKVFVQSQDTKWNLKIMASNTSDLTPQQLHQLYLCSLLLGRKK